MHVCAHQHMYVHAFVLIIRLYWPLRWQRLFWIINTEQIKILFKSLPRKLAWRERRHAHSTTSVFSPQPCFLFTSVSTTPAHVSAHLLPQHLCAMVIHRSKCWREVAFFWQETVPRCRYTRTIWALHFLRCAHIVFADHKYTDQWH